MKFILTEIPEKLGIKFKTKCAIENVTMKSKLIELIAKYIKEEK